MVAATSRRSASICTMPVSHGRLSTSNGTVTVRSSSQGATAVRRKIATSGRRRPNALTIWICRDAWPKPWPLM
jgi:hypothetical protein